MRSIIVPLELTVRLVENDALFDLLLPNFGMAVIAYFAEF
jgi:hypothetical protein